MAARPNYNPGGIVCTQYNAVDLNDVPLGIDDGDENVMIIPAEGDVAQSEYGCLTITEAAQTNGNCFSSPERQRPNGGDATLAGCAMRRVEYLGFVYGLATSKDLDGCTSGFAAPKRSDKNCAPCSKPDEENPRIMSTQWACALDCDGDILIDPEDGECWYEVTVTGPWDSVRKDTRFRSSNTVGNNSVNLSITLGESATPTGGPGGVFADDMLDDNGEIGCWAWWKGLTKEPPPCNPECECGGDSSGQFITLAGALSGEQPMPVG